MSSSRVERKRVFELKKEKKRRLILRDSDSDDSSPSPPRKKPVRDDEQSDIGSVVAAAAVVFQEGMKVDGKENGNSFVAADVVAVGVSELAVPQELTVGPLQIGDGSPVMISTSEPAVPQEEMIVYAPQIRADPDLSGGTLEPVVLQEEMTVAGGTLEAVIPQEEMILSSPHVRDGFGASAVAIGMLELVIPEEDMTVSEASGTLVTDVHVGNSSDAFVALGTLDSVAPQEGMTVAVASTVIPQKEMTVAVASTVIPQKEMTVNPTLIRNGSGVSAVAICALEVAVREEELKAEGKESMEACGKIREVFEEEVKAEQRDVERAEKLVSKRREESSYEKKKRMENRSTEKEKPRSVRMESGKQREEGVTFKKRIEEDKRNLVENRSADKERLKRFTRLDAGKQREEAAKKKFDEDKKKSAENRTSGKVELKADKQRDLKLDAGKQRVEASMFKKRSGEDIKLDKRKSGRKDEIPSFMKKALQRSTRVEEPKVSSKPELKGERKRMLSPDTHKRRGEDQSAKKFRSDKEDVGLDRKRPAISDAVEKRDGVVAGKKKAVLQNEGVDKMRSVTSDEVIKRELRGRDKKQATELSNSKLDQKRGREESDTDISLKRMKSELKSWQVETKKTDGKKMKFASKSGELIDDLVEKNPLSISLKTFTPKDEKVSGTDSSDKRTLQKRKDSNVQSVGIKKEESGITRDKGNRLQSKCNNLVQTSSKNLPEVKKIRTRREDGDRTESLSSSSSSSSSSNCSTPVHPDRAVEKLDSTVAVSKIQNTNNSSPEKNKSHESKRKLRTSSAELKSKVLPGKKPGRGRKAKGKNSSLETPLPVQKPIKGTEGRASVKRQISDKIKGILLSSGWRIDLRPRRGRNYEDQVYIPPTGGAGYWSITKAYAAFQKRLESAPDVKNSDLSEKSSKNSTGSDNNLAIVTPSSSLVPAELLSMLKRNVVNKRRSKITLVDSGTSYPLGKRNKQRGRPMVRGSNTETETGSDDYVPYVWKRTVLSWMIDLGIVPLNGKVNYMNKKKTRSMLGGEIVRDGIQCCCCSKVICVSKFELHAGSKLHQPYENIFVEESGVSLLQCQLNAWEKQDKSERQGFHTVNIEGDDPNDDACGICGIGGELICCDGCPSTFHQSCLGIEMLPLGAWHCTYCSCRFCGLVYEASDDGNDLIDSQLPSCRQCEKKYHKECIPKEEAISNISNNASDSFCGKSCRKVFVRLQKLLGVTNDSEAGFSWRLIRRLDEDSRLSSSGQSTRAECNAKIAVALAVMDECFLPIIDQSSHINLIRNVVYNCGSNFNRLNYSGFYTFTLEQADEIICVASVRIHGTRLAEMPFIGTRNMYRRQGMCRRLLDNIESALSSLGIQKLIIPAISELKDTWTNVFGFKPLGTLEMEEVKSMNILVFPETGLLEKLLLKKNPSRLTDEADKIKPRIESHNMVKAKAEASVGPDSRVSDEGVVHHEDENKDIKCSSSELDCSAPSFNVVPESLKTRASKFQATERKSPNGAAGSDQVRSLGASKSKLSSLDIAHRNEDVKIEDVGVVIVDTSVQHTSEANCESQDATISTLPDCGEKTLPNLASTGATSLMHNSDCHGISPGGTTVADSGGNDLLNQVTSLESIADATDHNMSDVKSSVTSLFPIGIQALKECTLDGNHGMNGQVAILQPEHNGECGSAPVVPGDCANSALSAHHSVKDINELDIMCDNNNAAPTETRNTLLCSTSVMVQNEVKGASEVTAKLPLEPIDGCGESTAVTGTLYVESASVQTTSAFGVGSSHCASKAVTTSLGNGSQSIDGSPDIGI